MLLSLSRLVTAVAITLGSTTALSAQIDTLARQRPAPAPARIGTALTDSVGRPPITPRRAFLYSFLLPGYSQGILGRNKAAVAFGLVEGISLVMIRESAADVHEARRIADDSVIVSYASTNGVTTRVTAPPRFTNAYVHTREAHVEDWVALLVANHLFAGADAYVAAHLWDVGAQLGMRLSPNGRALTASFKF